MAYLNELEVEKLLAWNTELPYEDKPRRSANFLLMGSEWYLLFSFQKSGLYYNLSLHRAARIGFSRIHPAVGNGPQAFYFHAKTCVSCPTDLGHNEKSEICASIHGVETSLWSCKAKEHIFQILPMLYNKGQIKFVCRFYGQTQSRFRLRIRKDPSTTTGTASVVGSDGPSDLECLSQDLGSLLEGEQLPDVRLNCGGQTFPAHRSVLAARSVVFAAMFRSQMSESETGGVDVKDFQPDVVREFLQYVYSGKMSAESGEAVASLFAMADKYAVESLKRACTRWIAGNLTEGNCVEYLTVADLHGSQELKQEIFAFMCAHPAVMLGGEWAEFSEKNSKLAMEVLQSFVRLKTESYSKDLPLESVRLKITSNGT